MSVAAAPLAANEAEFEFEAGPFASGELAVIEMKADEELSRPFAVDVTLAPREDQDVDAQALLGASGQLVVQLGDGTARWFHGVIAQVETWDGRHPDQRLCQVRLVPQLWTLGLVQHSRIFQNLSLPEIVQKVLKDGSVKSREALAAGYPKREFCVQYRETDLAFVSRLLEEAGIFYFFEHARGAHTMVLGDAPSSFPALAGGGPLVFREPSRMQAEGEYVDRFGAQLEVRPTKVALRDFNYLKPSVDLTTKAEAKAGACGALEIYDYPGGYEDANAGKSLSKVRLEEVQQRSAQTSGTSVSRRLLPGHVFALDEHPVQALDGAYVLLSVRHHGWQRELLKDGHAVAAAVVNRVVEQGEARPRAESEPPKRGYQNSFVCLRKGTPFRPARRTPRPVIAGVQTAMVVGPSGEEIHTDDHGRIKVQFHWDRDGKRDDKSSCWVRVSQSWAGPGWGALHLPRIGHEVIVEFIEGDPDRPIVTGCVYNGANPPPVPLPGEKTRSVLRSNTSQGGGGSNELMMEDAAGSEKVYLHAQKDLEIVTENDKKQQVKMNETLDVGRDRTITVGYNQSLDVAYDEKTKVGAKQTLEVGASRTVTISDDCSETIGGSHTVAITKDAEEKVDGDKRARIQGDFRTRVSSGMEEDVGGDSKLHVSGSRMVELDGIYKLEVSKDLTVKVDGASKSEVAKASELKAKEIVLEAQDSLTLKAGSASIELKKNGDIVLKGAKISVKASGDLILKGSKVAEN